jgi:hypothetical protein
VWLHHLGAREPSGGHGSYFGLKPGCSNVTVHNGFERLMGCTTTSRVAFAGYVGRLVETFAGAA